MSAFDVGLDKGLASLDAEAMLEWLLLELIPRVIWVDCASVVRGVMLLRTVPREPSTADGRGVTGACCEAVLEASSGRPGVLDAAVVVVADLEGSALSLRVAEAVEAIEDVEDIREAGVGLLPGLTAGVFSEGLVEIDGLGDAEGDARVDELVEVTREAGRALNRLFALGVAGGGDIRAERAEEATDDGLDVALFGSV